MINLDTIKKGFFSKIEKNNINGLPLIKNNNKEQLHKKLALLEIKNFTQSLSNTKKNTNLKFNTSNDSSIADKFADNCLSNTTKSLNKKNYI